MRFIIPLVFTLTFLTACNPGNLTFVRSSKATVENRSTVQRVQESAYSQTISYSTNDEALVDNHDFHSSMVDIAEVTDEPDQSIINHSGQEETTRTADSKQLYVRNAEKSEPSLKQSRTIVTTGTSLYFVSALVLAFSTAGAPATVVVLFSVLLLVGLGMLIFGFADLNLTLKQNPSLAYEDTRREQTIGLILLGIGSVLFVATSLIIIYANILPWLAILFYAFFLYSIPASISHLSRKSKAQYEEEQKASEQKAADNDELKKQKSPEEQKKNKTKAMIAISVVLVGLLALIIFA